MATERVGIDIGKGFIKYCYRGGTGEIPSYMSQGSLTRVVSGPAGLASNIHFAGKDYIIGESAPLGRGFIQRNDERKADERNLIFVLSVLARLDIYDAEIMVGLPVGTLERDKNEVKSLFSGYFDASVGGEKGAKKGFNIQTYVLSEPIGTYFSLVCNEIGQLDKKSQYYNKAMVIVDIGHSTLDIVVMDSGNLSPVKGSSLLGISTIFNQVWKHLEKDHGMVKANEQVDIINTIIKNPGTQVVIDGKMMNPAIWDKIKNWKMELAKNIIDTVKSSLGDLRPPVMLITGGGGLFLNHELRYCQRDIVMHADPRFANAIGFYRGLLYNSLN